MLVVVTVFFAGSSGGGDADEDRRRAAQARPQHQRQPRQQGAACGQRHADEQHQRRAHQANGHRRRRQGRHRRGVGLRREALTAAQHHQGHRAGLLGEAALEERGAVGDGLALPLDDLVAALQRRPRVATASDWITTPFATAAAQQLSSTLSPPAPALSAPIDWQRVRVLFTLGALVNHSSDPTHAAALREALRATVAEDPRYAMHPGALPSSAASRLRHGDLQAYSLEGTLSALRPGDANGSMQSVRAEVSLVLLAEPSHSIAATITGSATAQEARLAIANQPDPMPRLRLRAIEGAARGAMRSLQAQLLPRR